MADIIIKDIDKVFFSSEKSLGLHHISASYFAHFSFSLIIFIIVAIQHAIQEWQSGVKKVDWFDYASSHSKRLFSSFHDVFGDCCKADLM